ncbi:MAG TPA: hypothetical protein DEF41_14165 [Desulfovibrio sp.]|nr:hypothetical protein [Desulfovibrio sp.]
MLEPGVSVAGGRAAKVCRMFPARGGNEKRGLMPPFRL